ncbi:DUF3667 domain-containing protein [Flammeovirga kamogawensis]|uniref:DUF3667 domain-containing protein n=1 Tax=Flammeovirga kamogawensis TaxID=373891 RepID=A0ABX8GWJ4_9BACT|nr:DUF3667 domain-containing protein [Flammeovirga kamogawensis]MBB6461577.1 hypothetical protein [Flammeovirga kamogawensis]QWG07492.1 DUF3667 domain-containing protein [Flammeovirga kamogawensis]TRX69305.1 DUF3667 domain-containing protein [Flammeovirga kamogawensis]
MSKQDNCTNCKNKLKSEDQFCSQCGQSRIDYFTSFKTILKDTLDEVFGLDSKFKHTILPFLTKPQFLTEEFLKGKRQFYVHPIRLYLFCSIVFIFIFNNIIIDKHTIKLDFDKIFSKEEKAQASHNDSDTETTNDFNFHISDTNKEDSLNTKHILKVFEFIKTSNDFSDKTIQDSLNVDKWYQIKLIRQSHYFYDEKGVTFFEAVLENIPIAIMLLVPLFALYLKLLYVRKKHNFYIQHLIFSMHLHAFSLVFFSLFLIFAKINFISSDLFLIPIILYWLVISGLMFKKFYSQNWVKTIIKIFIAYSIHIIMIFWVVILELFISLLIF